MSPVDSRRRTAPAAYGAPDLEEPSLVAYELRDGRYQEIVRVVGAEAFQAQPPHAVTVVPAQLIRR